MTIKKKRLSFNDDFELLYLRHEYLEKIERLGKKIDLQWIDKYAGIVHTTAKIMFDRLKPNFQKVGFDVNDVIAVTNLYMLYYMTLYSVQTNPEAMDKLLAGRGPLPESEILRLDRNQMINFLRQRLNHCSTLFSRKARNITVGEDRRGFYAETENSQAVQLDLLLTKYKKYGYRKVTAQEYKAAKNEAKMSGSSDLKDKKGFKIVKVEQLNQGLSEYDFQLLSEDDKGTFYNPPDVIIQNNEEEVALEAFKIRFENLDENGKRDLLKKFIKTHEGDKKMKNEVKLAKKMLAKKTIVV